MKPRDYQLKYLNDIERGKKNLVHLATGGGKSVIFQNYISECLNSDRPVLFIVYGNSILDQAVNKYFKHYKVSKMQAKTKWSMSSILACSISTLAKKSPEQLKELLNYYKNIVVDEAHNATRDSYLNTLPDKNDESFTVVGLTATPYAIGKKGHTYWNNYIKHVTVRELIKKGWLVNPRVFKAQVQMDTKVKKTATDFNNKDLFEKNDNMVIYSSIIEEYLKNGENMPAICFAVNLEHSKSIAQSFNKIGIKAVHIEAKTPLEERAIVFEKFKKKEIQIICNVNIASTGVDLPIATVGIMARPTKSRVLWIQQVGRMLRPHPEKKAAIILDHGGNMDRCGHPLEDFEPVLKDGEGDKDPQIKTYSCPQCFFCFSEKTKECPSCGFINEPLKEAKEKELKTQEDIKLKEFNLKEEEKKKKQDEYQKKVDQWVKNINWYVDHPLVKDYFYLRSKMPVTKGLLLDVTSQIKPSDSFKSKEETIKRLNHCSNEVKDICVTFKNAIKKDHKPSSVFFKISAQYPDTKYLKYPKWFLNLQK